MKQTLEYLLQNIVSHPEDVVVQDIQDGESRTTLEIHTHPDDIARVIGRNGRIIKAVRDLIKIIAIQKNAFVDISIAE